MKSYSELARFDNYEDRLKYLLLNGEVAHATFGSKRWANQSFYLSPEWKDARRKAILRDEGCDLGIGGRYIYQGNLVVHHIVPITYEDIIERSDIVLSLDNLICVSKETHRLIHYGGLQQSRFVPMERSMYDTCPWKKIYDLDKKSGLNKPTLFRQIDGLNANHECKPYQQVYCYPEPNRGCSSG